MQNQPFIHVIKKYQIQILLEGVAFYKHFYFIMPLFHTESLQLCLSDRSVFSHIVYLLLA